MHHAFLYLSLTLLLYDYNMKLDKLRSYYCTCFIDEMSYVLTKMSYVLKKDFVACFPVRFFLYCRLFSPCWSLEF